MGTDYTSIVKKLVDDLKSIFTTAGLGGEAGEYKLLTQSFLYKFINDKFLYEAKKFNNENTYKKIMTMSDDEYEGLQMDLGNSSAKIKRKDLIETIFNKQNENNFSSIFDAALNDIATDNNDIYSVETESKSAIKLFSSKLIADIVDLEQRNNVARGIINKISEIKFDESIFTAGFDFFSAIFEYMIKDYNKDGGGKYAEYYTPHAVAKVIAKILVGNDKPENVRIYDPAAGSGTLLMNLASQIGTDKATVYSQDISQKSSNLLRMNLILNGLSHSINNIARGNTILNNMHPEPMDYVVSNPPFKLDFSDWRDKVESLPEYSTRFFAGVPNIPKKKKSGMAIYDLFIQQILYSLKENGKAAIVVPNGFLTNKSSINKKIRKRLVRENWLSGVISMPSNIFATTGTSVSVIFINKGRNEEQDKAFFVDASSLGHKETGDNSNQRTVLTNDEENKIITAFKNKDELDNFSISVSMKKIQEHMYSFAVGQYFPVKISYPKMTNEEVSESMKRYKNELNDLFSEGSMLEKNIKSELRNMNYE